jgi:hypothetical protein
VALLVARDFDAGKLKSVLPNLYQHVKRSTRGKRTLDHLYSTHRDAYKALPRPPFGKSDHDSILLNSAYKQQIKAGSFRSIKKWSDEAGSTRSITKWSDEADAKLQDCFASTDWNIFRDSSNGIEEYTISTPMMSSPQ